MLSTSSDIIRYTVCCGHVVTGWTMLHNKRQTCCCSAASQFSICQQTMFPIFLLQLLYVTNMAQAATVPMFRDRPNVHARTYPFLQDGDQHSHTVNFPAEWTGYYSLASLLSLLEKLAVSFPIHMQGSSHVLLMEYQTR